MKTIVLSLRKSVINVNVFSLSVNAEGKNIDIDYRFAEGKDDRLHQLAAELVRLNVDIIVAAASAAAAKNATNTINRLCCIYRSSREWDCASPTRLGGNVTGLTILAPELSGKRLELLKEAFFSVTRVAVLRNPTGINSPIVWKEAEAASQSFGLKLQSLEAQPRRF